MDPASLALLAGSAFKGIQAVVQAGGEIEHVTKKLGQWFTLASDFQDKVKSIENPLSSERSSMVEVSSRLRWTSW